MIWHSTLVEELALEAVCGVVRVTNPFRELMPGSQRGAKNPGPYTSSTGFFSVPTPLMAISTLSPGASVKPSGGTIPVPVSNTAP